MSKSTLDSDLYGDIYGDDDFLQDGDDESSALLIGPDEPAQQPPDDDSHPSSSQSTTSPTIPDPLSSLPAKPSSSTSSAMSYSAQIAKQFSAYQQTPSQERQQRREMSLPQNPIPMADRAAPIATFDSSANPATTDSVFGKKPSEMHDAGKMFIGGLNWDTTDEGLRDYFLQFGKVDACTIMRDPSGTSRGFAFLTFEDPASVDAVAASEHFLDGKAIDPKRAIPREEHLRNTRYFVGGLSPATTSESMRQFFSAYGKVVDATVMVDRDSGRSKGFGFVTFEDSGNSEQFVGKLGLILDDKEIEVKMAQPRSQREQGRAGTLPSSKEGYDREARVTTTNPSFMAGQTNPMSMMFQRSMNQLPMVGANMPMMNMNPMAMAMGMGMNGYNGMTGMNAMNMMGMGGMNNMSGMNGLGGMGPVRLGMGPLGSVGMGAGIGNMPIPGSGMNGMGMSIRPMMNGMGNGGLGRTTLNSGPGPSRMSSRGQHNFHPYAR